MSDEQRGASARVQAGDVAGSATAFALNQITPELLTLLQTMQHNMAGGTNAFAFGQGANASIIQAPVDEVAVARGKRMMQGTCIDSPPVPPSNDKFTGRENLLAKMQGECGDLKRSQCVQVLTGIGGVGKSQVALEYLHRYQKNYQCVICWRGDRLDEDIRRFAAWIGIPCDMHSPIQGIADAVYERLGKLKKVLIVVDDPPQEVAHLLPRSGARRYHIVITTQQARPWQDCYEDAKVHELEGFSPEEAHDYLRSMLSQVVGSEENSEGHLKALATAGDCFPLALAQIASYIKRHYRDGVTIAHYLDLHADNSAALADCRATGLYDKTLLTALLMNLPKLWQVSPSAMKLLCQCAFLAPTQLSTTLARALRGDTEANGSAEEVRVREDLTLLCDMSFLDREDTGDSYRMHQALQRVLRQWLQGEVHVKEGVLATDLHGVAEGMAAQQLAAQTLCLGLTSSLLRHSQQQDGSLSDIMRRVALMPHLRVLATACEPLLLADNSLVLADIYERLAMIGIYLGGSAVQVNDYQQAYEFRKVCLGADDRRTLISKLNFLNCCFMRGEIGASECVEELEEILAAQQISVDGDMTLRNDIAATHITLANHYIDIKLYRAAEKNLKAAIAIQDELFGENTLPATVARMNLACLLGVNNKHTAKRDMLKEVLAVQLRFFPPTHPLVVNTRINLANAHGACGDIAIWHQQLETLWEEHEGVYGEEHPTCIDILVNVAAACAHMTDDKREGRVLFLERACRLQLNYFGDKHPKTRHLQAELNTVRAKEGYIPVPRDVYGQKRVSGTSGEDSYSWITEFLNSLTKVRTAGRNYNLGKTKFMLSDVDITEVRRAKTEKCIDYLRQIKTSPAQHYDEMVGKIPALGLMCEKLLTDTTLKKKQQHRLIDGITMIGWASFVYRNQNQMVQEMMSHFLMQHLPDHLSKLARGEACPMIRCAMDICHGVIISSPESPKVKKKKSRKHRKSKPPRTTAHEDEATVSITEVTQPTMEETTMSDSPAEVVAAGTADALTMPRGVQGLANYYKQVSELEQRHIQQSVRAWMNTSEMPLGESDWQDGIGVLWLCAPDVSSDWLQRLFDAWMGDLNQPDWLKMALVETVLMVQQNQPGDVLSRGGATKLLNAVLTKLENSEALIGDVPAGAEESWRMILVMMSILVQGFGKGVGTPLFDQLQSAIFRFNLNLKPLQEKYEAADKEAAECRSTIARRQAKITEKQAALDEKRAESVTPRKQEKHDAGIKKLEDRIKALKEEIKQLDEEKQVHEHAFHDYQTKHSRLRELVEVLKLNQKCLEIESTRLQGWGETFDLIANIGRTAVAAVGGIVTIATGVSALAAVIASLPPTFGATAILLGPALGAFAGSVVAATVEGASSARYAAGAGINAYHLFRTKDDNIMRQLLLAQGDQNLYTAIRQHYLEGDAGQEILKEETKGTDSWHLLQFLSQALISAQGAKSLSPDEASDAAAELSVILKAIYRRHMVGKSRMSQAICREAVLLSQALMRQYQWPILPGVTAATTRDVAHWACEYAAAAWLGAPDEPVPATRGEQLQGYIDCYNRSHALRARNDIITLPWERTWFVEDKRVEEVRALYDANYDNPEKAAAIVAAFDGLAPMLARAREGKEAGDDRHLSTYGLRLADALETKVAALRGVAKAQEKPRGGAHVNVRRAPVMRAIDTTGVGASVRGESALVAEAMQLHDILNHPTFTDEQKIALINKNIDAIKVSLPSAQQGLLFMAMTDTSLTGAQRLEQMHFISQMPQPTPPAVAQSAHTTLNTGVASATATQAADGAGDDMVPTPAGSGGV